MSLSKLINEICKQKRISLYRLSVDSDIAYSYVRSLALGKQGNPSVDILDRLAKGLKVPRDLVDRSIQGDLTLHEQDIENHISNAVSSELAVIFDGLSDEQINELLATMKLMAAGMKAKGK